jgi:AraC family transcriptional regulator
MPNEREPSRATQIVLGRAPSPAGRQGYAQAASAMPGARASLSRRIAWRGGSATAHLIPPSMAGSAVTIRPAEPHCAWSLWSANAAARPDGSHPRYALVVAAGSETGLRLRQALEIQLLSIELDQEFLHCLAFEHLRRTEGIALRDCADPLCWQLARAIYGECSGGAPQGVLYAETAATMLAMHLARTLSAEARPAEDLRRGGLPPVLLQRACDYMTSRLGEEVSLREIAAIAGLSAGHFSIAFKQSLGIAPSAWLRRRRIERAKALLRDGALDLTEIALIFGYANQSALGVAFKRETGLTPTRWRRLHLS